jgi:hypothetical protein
MGVFRSQWQFPKNAYFSPFCAFKRVFENFCLLGEWAENSHE